MRNFPSNITRVRTENWKLASPEQRIQILQDLEDGVAKEQGREARRVSPTKMSDDGYCGKYDSNKPDEIQINEDYLDDRLVDQGINYLCMETILHEGRHAYQDDAMNGKIQHDRSETELWKMNNTGNIYKTEQNGYYRYQPVEADANDFSHAEINDLHKYLGDDPGYDKYFVNREYSDSLYKEDARTKYGDDYQKEIANSVREQYIEIMSVLQEKYSEYQPFIPDIHLDVSLIPNELKNNTEEEEEEYSYGMGL